MTARPSLLLVLALAVALPAPGLRAEDAPPRPTRRGDGFRFTPPGAESAPAPGAETGPTAPAPEEPLDPREATLRRLVNWPGPDGIRAAESLVLAGTDSIEPCLEVLTKGNPSARPGAAWVLGKVGTRDHVPAILRAAAESRSSHRLETFFDAAWELDTALTKKWLFSFMTLERPVFRARATEFLAGVVTPEDRPRIDGLVAAPARQPGVRIAGLELLMRTQAADAPDKLMAALGDPHPDVARRASQLLASAAVRDAALLVRLNEVARDADARPRAYATLALVEFNRRERRNGFEPATVPQLIGRRGLMHPDRLSRGASAIGLAFGALDSDVEAVGPLLDRDVVSVLIDTVGGNHFLDYGSLVEPCFAALRRLSGIDLPSTASPWAQWWLESQDGFRARRTLSGVAAADLVRSRVIFDVVDAEGRRRRSAFVPEGAETTEGAFLLPMAAYQALVAGLEDAGVFESADDARSLAEEHLAVRVGVMNQEKRLVLVPQAEDPRHDTLLARLEALEDLNLWQRYRDTDEFPNARAWWKRQSQLFSAAEPEQRRAELAHAVAVSFDDLDGDGPRVEALDLLERIGEGLPDTDLTLLLAWAASSATFGRVEARLVEWVLGLQRPALLEPTVEALARAQSPEAAVLLADTISASGPARVREAMADPRASVRAAAAAAAADLLAGPMGRDPTARARLGEALKPGLEALLVDPDPIVRVRAATSLAILGDAAMIERLENVYRQGDTPTKIAVAQAYGRIGGTAIQPLLVRMIGEVGEGSAPVRAAALQAMAASRSPDAVRILAFYMLNDADMGVQLAAEQALTAMHDADARKALSDLLDAATLDAPKKARVLRALATFEGEVVRDTLAQYLEDQDAPVVDQAALGLAEHREASAVPYLLAILDRPEEALRPKALEAMQDLTSLTLPVTSYAAAAEQYGSWYRQHRQGNDRAWFRDAVAKKGYDATSLEAYARGERDLAAVTVLLRTVRDDDPVIRRNSDLALRRVTGHAPPRRLDRTTTREEATRMADRWASWWQRNRPEGAR